MNLNNIKRYMLINNTLMYHVVLPFVATLIISKCLRFIPTQIVYGLVSIILDGSTLFGVQDVSKCSTIDNCVYIGQKMLNQNVSTIAYQTLHPHISTWEGLDITYVVYILVSICMLSTVSMINFKWCKCVSKTYFISLIFNFFEIMFSIIFLIATIIMEWNNLLSESRTVLLLFGCFILVPLLCTLVLQYALYVNFRTYDNDDTYDNIYSEDAP